MAHSSFGSDGAVKEPEGHKPAPLSERPSAGAEAGERKENDISEDGIFIPAEASGEDDLSESNFNLGRNATSNHGQVYDKSADEGLVVQRRMPW